jgi:hypothetical protein
VIEGAGEGGEGLQEDRRGGPTNISRISVALFAFTPSSGGSATRGGSLATVGLAERIKPAMRPFAQLPWQTKTSSR